VRLSLSHAPRIFPTAMLATRAQRLAALFFALWLFIIFVSAIDGYLVFRYRQLIHSTELNPVGRMLLEASGGQIWMLLGLKLAGTIAACAVLLLVYWKNAQRGTLIAAAVAAAQLTLLLFLLFG
jgi:hypothetical protein